MKTSKREVGILIAQFKSNGRTREWKTKEKKEQGGIITKYSSGGGGVAITVVVNQQNMFQRSLKSFGYRKGSGARRDSHLSLHYNEWAASRFLLLALRFFHFIWFFLLLSLSLIAFISLLFCWHPHQWKEEKKNECTIPTSKRAGPTIIPVGVVVLRKREKMGKNPSVILRIFFFVRYVRYTVISYFISNSKKKNRKSEKALVKGNNRKRRTARTVTTVANLGRVRMVELDYPVS